jgi:hypothetical protein
MKSLEPRRLAPWEEGALRLKDLVEEVGRLIACGDTTKLSLPLELKDDLSKYIGMRISILRTDTGYRTRILDEES